jgi:PII-like signaling protein
VRAPATKLTVYFSERTRTGEGFLADALLELYGRHRIHTSVLLRGADGFGVHHGLHTDRLLSASENLPAVSIAVDTRERIDAALPDVQALASGAGLITSASSRIGRWWTSSPASMDWSPARWSRSRSRRNNTFVTSRPPTRRALAAGWRGGADARSRGDHKSHDTRSWN